MELAGGREMVNEARAEELIKGITAVDPTSISLSNKSFDNGAATKIAAYVSSLSGVTVADIGDMIAGRPEDEALRTLKIICSSFKKFDLEEVDLSDNALGAKGVTECIDVLLGSSLKRLYVCNNGLSAEAAELLAKILLRQATDAVPSDATLSPVPTLELLHFYNNMAGDGGAKALAEIVKACGASLQDFRFSATRSTPAGCESIAAALASVPKLRKLDLCDNNFNGKTGDVLKEALRFKTCLEHVNLRDDSLEGTVGVDKLSIFEALVEATAAGSAIKFLDLSGNSFDADAAAQLARALDRMPTIETLMIDDCELGSQGAKHIANAVKGMPNLKTLSMCTCEITASGGYHLAKAVASIRSFTTLNVDGNMFTADSVEAIRGVLVQASKVLGELEDNDEDGDDDLEDALADYEDEEEEERAAEEDGTEDLISSMAGKLAF